MPALTASCHCGAVKVEVPRKPRSLTDCNCSICLRYGTRWAYFKDAEVRLIAGPRATDEYIWGDRTLKFIRCSKCGCVMQWKRIVVGPTARTGVNARNFEPSELGDVRVRLLDGAKTWKYIG
jgi:hypothetical protein